MKLLIIALLFIFSFESQQKEITVEKKGWLIYRYGDNLAFFPIKDQAKTPSYRNFLTEKKEDGQRMNNNYSAPSKLLLSKLMSIGVYNFDPKLKKEIFMGNEQFYVQPVKYVYKVTDPKTDTADYQFGIMGWTFSIRGKPVKHNVFYFNDRSGSIYYLNQKDSLSAARGGRRKNIEIYPPH